MNKKKSKLVLDANAFIGHPEDIKNLRILYDLVVTPDVIQELKDGAAREAFMILKPFLKKRTPSENTMKEVRKFAKKTGDLARLSKQDIGVIAAAIDLIKKREKTHMLNKRPKTMRNKYGKKKNKKKKEKKISKKGEDKVEEDKIEEDKVEETITQNEDIELNQKNESLENKEDILVEENNNNENKINKDIEDDIVKKNQEEKKEDTYCNGWVKDSGALNSECNDYSGGWLGPANIGKLNTKQGEESTNRLKEIGIGVVTSDFAMQNVILQIGIPLLSLDGSVISKLKSYVLECFSCGKMEKDCSKQFCDKCGKSTLSRVTCEYDQNGKLILYRKKNYQPKKRGTRYNIPNPKGGRRIHDLLLSKDSFNQPKVVSYLRKQKQYQKKQEKKMNVDWDLGFGFELGKDKRKNFHDLEIGYGRKNPNVNAFWKKKKRRK